MRGGGRTGANGWRLAATAWRGVAAAVFGLAALLGALTLAAGCGKAPTPKKNTTANCDDCNIVELFEHDRNKAETTCQTEALDDLMAPPGDGFAIYQEYHQVKVRYAIKKPNQICAAWLRVYDKDQKLSYAEPLGLGLSTAEAPVTTYWNGRRNFWNNQLLPVDHPYVYVTHLGSPYTVQVEATRSADCANPAMAQTSLEVCGIQTVEVRGFKAVVGRAKSLDSWVPGVGDQMIPPAGAAAAVAANKYDVKTDDRMTLAAAIGSLNYGDLWYVTAHVYPSYGLNMDDSGNYLSADNMPAGLKYRLVWVNGCGDDPGSTGGAVSLMAQKFNADIFITYTQMARAKSVQYFADAFFTYWKENLPNASNISVGEALINAKVTSQAAHQASAENIGFAFDNISAPKGEFLYVLPVL